jgi:hypothetical protein
MFTFFFSQQAKAEAEAKEDEDEEAEGCFVVAALDQSKSSGNDKGRRGHDSTSCSARTNARVNTTGVEDPKVEFKLGRCRCLWRISLQGTKTTPAWSCTSELHRAASRSCDDSISAEKGGKQNGLKETHLKSITAGQTGQAIGRL